MGITTNLLQFQAIMRDPEFIAGHLHTGFLDELTQRALQLLEPDENLVAGILAAASLGPPLDSTAASGGNNHGSSWREFGRKALLR